MPHPYLITHYDFSIKKKTYVQLPKTSESHLKRDSTQLASVPSIYIHLHLPFLVTHLKHKNKAISHRFLKYTWVVIFFFFFKIISHQKGSAYQYPPSTPYLLRFRLLNTIGVRSFLLLLRAMRIRSKNIRSYRKHQASGPPENVYDVHPAFPHCSPKPSK